MIPLSKSEEELMNHIWRLKKSYMKDLINSYPDPKPAATTIATLLKRMIGKGFINYSLTGKSRLYFPLVLKHDYFSNHLKGLIKNYFDDSAGQFASFFTEEVDLSQEELQSLRKLIDKQLKENK
jgi:predicted transcriptional regulator